MKTDLVQKRESSLIDLLEQKVKECLSLAEDQYQRKFDYRAVHVNIRGRAAGQIRYENPSVSNVLPLLRFNPYLLERYKESFVEQVVPHECAHLVAYALYGIKIKPHGAEWKSLMRDLYNQTPAVTHHFDMPQKARKTFAYQCACPGLDHSLSVIRHNKILRQKARYLCKNCGSALEEG